MKRKDNVLCYGMFVFFASIILQISMIFSTQAAETEFVVAEEMLINTYEEVPYTVDNSIQVSVTVPKKTVLTSKDFPEVSCSNVYVASMEKVDEGYIYELILVLDVSSEDFDLTDEMIKIKTNPLIVEEKKTEYVTIHSYMELSDSAIVLEVGKSADVKINELKFGHNQYYADGIKIIFDPKVIDMDILDSMFSEYGLTEINWIEDNTYCIAKKKQYVDQQRYVEIVDSLSKVDGVEEVSLHLVHSPPAGNLPTEVWNITDETIASFTLSGGELDPYIHDIVLNQTATITALKLGTTTISVERREMGMEAKAQCVITVLAPDFVIEDGVLVNYIGDDEVVVIPNGVVEIADNAFARNTTITSVSVPEGVTEIGEKVFQGCTNLSELNLPDSLTRIGFAALDGCESLDKLTLPVGIETLYTNIFADVDHYVFATPGPVEAYFNPSYIKELTILNPQFVLFTEEEESEWPDPMSQWPKCMVKLETIYGYMDCGAEYLAPGKFVSLSESLDDVASNYSNMPKYVGDVDNDNQVSAEDALSILQHVVLIKEIESPESADIDGEDGVTAQDALQVLRYVVNLDEKVTYKPSAFETHQFTVNAKFQQLAPDVVNETTVIENIEELSAFLDTIYEKYYTEHNKEDFKVVKAHFASLDDTYFNENVCVITVDAGKLEWGRYRANTLTNRDTIVNDEMIAKRGLVLNYYVGADTPVDGIAEYATYILVSETTIPKESLEGAILEHVTFRKTSKEKF